MRIAVEVLVPLRLFVCRFLSGRRIILLGILIDMTLYATSGRLPNNFKMCEFWVKDRHSNQLRKAIVGRFQDEFVENLEAV